MLMLHRTVFVDRPVTKVTQKKRKKRGKKREVSLHMRGANVTQTNPVDEELRKKLVLNRTETGVRQKGFCRQRTD